MKNQISFQNPFPDISDGVFLVVLEYLQAKPSILEGLLQEALTFSKCSLLDQRLEKFQQAQSQKDDPQSDEDP